MWAIAVHLVLIVVQLAYLTFIIVAPLLGTPAAVYVGVIVAGIWINKCLCDAVLNFGDKVYSVGGEYSINAADVRLKLQPAKYPGERWVFVNGVAAGSHWLDSNLERIAKTFQRPVLGIQNASYGIIFDVLECIIQRTFTYATTDIRTVYQGISELVQDPEVHKVVLIAHSQGCIELGMALDWLYVTRPMTDIAKIEVYTFGNAANHWNCLQHENGQRVIPHVEHYANTSDWVARFGVIFFRGLDRWRPCTQLQKALPVAGEGEVNGDRKVEEEHVDLRNRFVGKLFLRQASGHQFNQHYLNNMFTMNRGNQIVLDSNRFIRSVVKDDNFQDGQVSPSPAADVQKLVNGRKGLAESTRLLQDESRLWQYRNGGAPS